jgi:hypothetical protein
MTMKFAFAMMAMLATPSLAAAQSTTDDHAMAPAGAMAHDDKMMAADHAMAPMSKHDKAMMAKCAKMSAAKAAKNAMCAKMAMHHDGHM